MGRPLGPMTAKIEKFIRMEARGEDHAFVLQEVFGIGPDADPKTKHNAEATMNRWRYRPDAKAIWEDEIRNVVRACIPSAMNRIKRQVNDDNGWLANKAANDVISMAKTVTVFAENEKAVNVRIEGMPDLGTPDQDE
jgi:hypothetical protein